MDAKESFHFLLKKKKKQNHLLSFVLLSKKDIF